jgi:FHA domain
MSLRMTNFFDKARKLESALAAGIEGASRRATRASQRPPLEIVVASVDALEQMVQPDGTFPFTHVELRFAAASTIARAHFEAVCEGPPSLRARIVDRLETSCCTVKALAVNVSFADEAQEGWSHAEFNVDCTRRAGSDVPPVRLQLTVTQGTADRTVYIFDSDAIALGRGDEVRDDGQRLLRTNQVAFTEGAGEVNQSVSRRHAHIERAASETGYRLYDDGSAQGTCVIRGGRGCPVPRGTKGLRLQSGDEIMLGQARLRVKI